MGEFNVNKTDGSLIPTAGYGGMIKINGITLADLIAALNGMTEDQKTRCEVLLYLNGENLTNFFVLKRCNVTISNVGSETHDIYSCSDDEVTIYDGTTRITHYATSLHITKLTSGTTAKISRVSGSNGYDLTSSLSSWSILYQDDSTSGGNTYPASQVYLSGGGNVEDALAAKADLTDLASKANSSDVPSRGKIAQTFSESKNYARGTIVWYNDDLYEFISDHDAGAWNNSHAILVTISSSINRRNTTTFQEVVRVTADGVKTYSELLDSIYASRGNAYVLEVNGDRMWCANTSYYYGSVELNSVGNIRMYCAYLKSSGSIYKTVNINSSTGAISVADLSSSVPYQSRLIRFLRYGAIN